MFLLRKCIFLEESTFFCRKEHFSVGEPMFLQENHFSAVHSWGSRIMNGSLLLDDCWKGFPANFDAAGKLFSDFPAARNAVPAKVWALSGKENGCWKIGRACGKTAGLSPPRPPKPSWDLLNQSKTQYRSRNRHTLSPYVPCNAPYRAIASKVPLSQVMMDGGKRGIAAQAALSRVSRHRGQSQRWCRQSWFDEGTTLRTLPY